ncbi:MAG TPA: Fe(2+)-trafficking protein [Tepidisphaeraceae bacterium]|jgi:Fe-S cluster biosynthesis and repair protein YggX|nr:Fe(2+)-trafficking protein [Tepidisphaeraceae bacterium]
MPTSQERIDQFKKMAADDPKNELGHFSLGRAYLDAGQYNEAVKSFEHTLVLNNKLSKAYQLIATALLKQDLKSEAIDRLTQGVLLADERGDVLPRNEMVKMLEELGAPVPMLKSANRTIEVGEGQVLDRRTGQPGTKLPRPPFSNKMGQMIYANVSAESWREWIGMGTKVINELRLPLSDPQAQKVFDEHMLDFLNLKDVWEEWRAKP